MRNFNGKLAVLQRVVPVYRAPFFETLAARCRGGLTLLAGEPLEIEGIQPAGSLRGVRFHRTTNRHFFHPRHPLYFCFQTGIGRWLAQEEPDALVIEANPRYLGIRRSVAALRAQGTPVLGWGLGAPPLDGPFAKLREEARARLVGMLDGVIAYSARGAAEYRALGVLPPERVFTAPNAAAPPPGSPVPSRGPLRHPRSLLFVGRLQDRKRLDLLFEACARLPENLQPELTIVGDGPARQRFENTAAAVYPRTTFKGGRYGEALAGEFADADLFVLPGTGGLAVQEAMSHALPVLVGEGDGTQQDLVRPENGWQVPPGDLEALVRALQKALTDPELRAKGAESRRIVEEEINIERMADRFVAAIQTVIGAG